MGIETRIKERQKIGFQDRLNGLGSPMGIETLIFRLAPTR